VISRDAGLVEPFLDWGFSPGAVPLSGRPVHRMDEFRAWFVDAFSGVDGTGSAFPSPAHTPAPAER
jgi:hypothetical protein